MDRVAEKLIAVGKKKRLAAAARRARDRKEHGRWIDVGNKLAAELHRIADNGQFISEVNIRVRFDGCVISDSKIKAEGRKTEPS